MHRRGVQPTKARNVTDEGIIVHESDPTTSGDGLGLVWGSVLWPSGISLAKYLSYLGPDSVLRSSSTRTHILELGCGTGVVGLTLAKTMAGSSAAADCRVTLSDSEPALWPILRRSLAANDLDDGGGNDGGSRVRVDIRCVDWRDTTTFVPPGCADLIVAADVLYAGMDRLFARALASHLPSLDEVAEAGKTRAAEALIACPYRTDSPLGKFFDVCDRLGLAFERLENGDGHAAGAFHGIDPVEAFGDSRFVPLDSEESRRRVATEPTFADNTNVKEVQIFRVRRVAGTAVGAARIRRLGQI